MNTASVSELLAQGNTSYAQGNILVAAEIFRRAAEVYPGSFAAHANLGNTLMQLHRYEEAIHVYLKALALKGSAALVARNLGLCFDKTNRLELAGQYYRLALGIRPDFTEAMIDLGNVHQKLGNNETALEYYTKALNIDPHLSNAMHNIGLCLYDDSNLEAAERAFSKAVDMDPQNALGACFLGIILEHQGKHNKADRLLRLARQGSARNNSIIESSRYAFEKGGNARYFSNTADVLRYAISRADTAGLFMEFGVYYGSSLSVIAQSTGNIVHGFDSFEGLPESWFVGSEKGSAATEPSGAYTTRGALPNVPENVVLHAGWFEETVPDFINNDASNASFINIDCDIYSSTKTILDCLESRIHSGAIIVFDEYFCYPEWQDHEYKAFQEMISGSPYSYEYIAFSYFTGQAAVRILP